MGFTVYEPAPAAPDERERARAVVDSGALDAIDDAGLQALAAEARHICGTGMSAISILYGSWQYVIAAAGLPTGPSSRHTSFCGHATLASDGVFCVPDALADPRFAGNPAVEHDHLLRFYAGVTVLSEDKVPLGMVCVFDPQPRAPLAPAEIARLRTIADAATARLRTLRPA